MDPDRSDGPARLPVLVVLGRNLYRLRTLRIPRLSQDELAEKSGVSVNTIGALESARNPAKMSGVSFPQLDTIEKLAVALGCSVADLLDEDAVHSVGWSNPGWINHTDSPTSSVLATAVR